MGFLKSVVKDDTIALPGSPKELIAGRFVDGQTSVGTTVFFFMQDFFYCHTFREGKEVRIVDMDGRCKMHWISWAREESLEESWEYISRFTLSELIDAYMLRACKKSRLDLEIYSQALLEQSSKRRCREYFSLMTFTAYAKVVR